MESDLPHKLKIPSGRHLCPRRRIFPYFDNPSTSMVWIYGPAGAGKTSLVISYLNETRQKAFWYTVDPSDADIANLFYYLKKGLLRLYPSKVSLPILSPEYYSDIETFSARFFEKFFSFMKPQSVVVFDSCQEIDDEEVFFKMLYIAAMHLPEGIKMILTSRKHPPPPLLSFLYSGKMKVIDYRVLRLDLQETEELIRLRRDSVSPEMVKQVHSITDGWALGVVLVSETLNKPKTGYLPVQGDNRIFEYLATDAFNKLSPVAQKLLLSVAYFRRFTVDMARMASGIDDVHKWLEYLERNSVFITRVIDRPLTYQAHPLFRTFLTQQLEKNSNKELHRKVLFQTGRIMESEGEIEDAAEMYSLSSQWQELKKLVLNNAEDLIEQGRFKLLLQWIQWLLSNTPDIDPDLLYYRAHCLPPTDPERVLAEFEHSYRLYRQRGDVEGMYRCLAGSMECILNNPSKGEVIDRWLKIWEQLQRENPDLPTTIRDKLAPRILMALIHRRPNYREFQRWEFETERVLKRTSSDKDRLYAAVALASVHLWKGEFDRASTLMGFYTSMIQQENAPPLPRILLCMIQAWYLWGTGQPKKCIEVAQKGLEIARYHGIRLWDFLLRFHLICAYLSMGKQEEAESLLRTFEENLSSLRPFDLFYYHYSSTWLFLQKGNLYAASIHAESAHRLAERMGLYHCRIQAEYLMAVVASEKADLTDAKRHIQKGKRLNRAFRSVVLQYMFLLLEAKCAFQADRETQGLRLLKRALSTGAKRNLRNFSTWVPIDKTHLALKAIKHGIETEYLKELIRQRRYMFDMPVFDVIDWPWQVKVYTMGDFRILKDDMVVNLSGKIQKRPLELLKILIAAGGQTREEWIVERLWKERELEDAHRAFLTTIHRLRKLLSCEKCIHYQDGLVRIDPRYLWVDSITFLKMMERAEDLWQTGEKKEARDTAERALELYRGQFLPSTDPIPWAEGMRQSLRVEFLKWILRIGEIYEDERNLQDALDLYKRARDLEPLEEELYRRLMVLYGRKGRKAEVVRTYRLCAETLWSHLQLRPSRITEETYRAVINDLL